ncbi:MAG: hypothetical protein WCH34_09525 [Bacteroidota bacterium]
MNSRFAFILSFCILLSNNVSAQYFTTGQDAASIKWNQIKTDDFQIVFPSQNAIDAQLIANLLGKSKKNISQAFNISPRKISLLLHTQTSYPNAMVAWAPKRIEFYSFSSPVSYPQLWMKQLVVHEFRHVVQIEKLNTGFTHFASYLFGQQIISLVQGIFIPPWLAEGDAVVTETVLSNSGRGRDPYFVAKLKAQLEDKGIYSFAKASFGSYRDFVPDSYALGYHLVGWGRQNYGDQLWEKTFKAVAYYPFSIFPFTSAIHRQTGMWKNKFYKTALNDLKLNWEKQDAQKSVNSPYTYLTPLKARNYSSYICGGYIHDTLLVASLRCIDDIERIVTINPKGKIKKLITPGYTYFESLTAQNNKICWSQRTFSPRWDNQSWSVLKVYDAKTIRIKQLGRKSYYHSPALSHDATKVACVEALPSGSHNICVLNTDNGNLIQKISLGDTLELFSPSWSGNDEKICFVMLTNSGKAIFKWDIANNSIQRLSEVDFYDKANPTFYDKFILFASNMDASGDIFALDTITKKIYKITQSKYCAMNPFVDIKRNKLLFSDYTADGFRLAEIDLAPANWKSFETYQKNYIPVYHAFAKEEQFNIDTLSTPDSVYTIKKYSKTTHLFNIHSWAPGLSIDVSNQTLKPGASLFSQNLLSTSFLSLNYLLPTVENKGIYSLQYAYKGWYPELDLQVDFSQPLAYNPLSTLHPQYSWNNLSIKAATQINWQFTEGAYSFGLNPKLQTSYLIYDKGQYAPDSFPNGNLQTLEYQLFLYNQRKMSYRDIEPRFAQQLQLNYKHTPFNGFKAGNIFSAQASFYFPSVFHHHSLNLYGAYQQRKTADFAFSSIIPYPRGGFTQLYGNQAYLLSASYVMPLFYPDWSLTTWFYIKRFQAKLFADYVENRISSTSTSYKTAGIDLSSEVRIVVPLQLGIRIGYDSEHTSPYYQLLYTIQFDSFY